MKKIDALLQKEMSRKQFIMALGMAIAGLFGLSTLLGLFTKNISSHDSNLLGYGEHHYGP